MKYYMQSVKLTIRLDIGILTLIFFFYNFRATSEDGNLTAKQTDGKFDL